MININQLDPANLATISAIVAALVTVLGNAFQLPTRYRSLLAIGVAVILVLLPQILLNKVLIALIIGLTASGVYSQVKPLKLLEESDKRSVKKNNKKEIVEKKDDTINKSDINTVVKTDSKEE